MVTLAVAKEQAEVGEGLAQRPSQKDVDPGRSVCKGALFGFQGGHIGGLVAGDDGALFVSETSSATIWRLGPDAAPDPIAGPGSGGGEEPLRLFAPSGVAIGPDGILFVADSTRHRICALASDGTLRVVAGGTNGYGDGPGAQAMFRFPSDVAVAPDGTCYVADTVNDRIRAIAADGEVRTVAGSIYDYGDGRGARARFRRPAAIDLDEDGTLYVADTGNNAIRAVTPDGEVTTIAGQPPGGDSDGRGTGVGLRWPTGIAVGAEGLLWVADHGNAAVRHISPTGESTTELRLSGLRPTVLARGPDGTVFIAVEAWAVGQSPRACITAFGDRQ